METNKELPRYEIPQVITYSNYDILEELGPALATTGYDDPGCIPDGAGQAIPSECLP